MCETWGEHKKSAINVALAPIFAPKSEKCLERADKPTGTLATQATLVAQMKVVILSGALKVK